MVEVEHALIAQKEEFQMRMESLQQRTEELGTVQIFYLRPFSCHFELLINHK